MAMKDFDPAKKALSLMEEFKAFALKGSVFDLAVGVIIGAAFGAIINSLVKDIIMPLISTIMPGEQGYQGWHITVNGVVIPYGKFLGEVVNFLIIAIALYIIIVKLLGWLMRVKKDAPPPPTPADVVLLTEIRDLLKKEAAH